MGRPALRRVLRPDGRRPGLRGPAASGHARVRAAPVRGRLRPGGLARAVPPPRRGGEHDRRRRERADVERDAPDERARDRRRRGARPRRPVRRGPAPRRRDARPVLHTHLLPSGPPGAPSSRCAGRGRPRLAGGERPGRVRARSGLPGRRRRRRRLDRRSDPARRGAFRFARAADAWSPGVRRRPGRRGRCARRGRSLRARSGRPGAPIPQGAPPARRNPPAGRRPSALRRRAVGSGARRADRESRRRLRARRAPARGA